MAKVTLVLELNKVLCDELDSMRTMVETSDFSGLKATIERVQQHGNSMESAIRAYNNTFYDIWAVFDPSKRDAYDGQDKWVLDTDEQKLNKLKEIFDNRKIRNTQ